MHTIDKIGNFNAIKRKVANDLNVDYDSLSDLTYYKYTEDSIYSEYPRSKNIEEWLKTAISILEKRRKAKPNLPLNF